MFLKDVLGIDFISYNMSKYRFVSVPENLKVSPDSADSFIQLELISNEGKSAATSNL